MKQMVVGLLVVVGVFTVGPWFAGRVGPPLADAITEWATPEKPCATATAKPSRKAQPTAKKAHPEHDRPRARVNAHHRPSARADREQRQTEPQRHAGRKQRERKAGDACEPAKRDR